MTDKIRCAQIVGRITDGGTKTDYDLTPFNKLARKLRKEYDFVYNPADYEKPGKKWAEYMYDCLDSIITDRPDIYALKGWENGVGTLLEIEFAKRLGLRIEEV